MEFLLGFTEIFFYCRKNELNIIATFLIHPWVDDHRMFFRRNFSQYSVCLWHSSGAGVYYASR